MDFRGGGCMVTIKELAWEWWMETGQYWDCDEEQYPKDLVLAAFEAGLEVGKIITRKTAAAGDYGI